MHHAKYQGSRPCGFGQEDFFYVFSNISQCKICDPRGGAIFCLRNIIHKVMLHTKYHGSMPNGFRQEYIFMFLPIQAYVKHVTPGVGPFLPEEYNLNKLGRRPLDNAS